MNRINPGLSSAAFTAWVRATWPDRPNLVAIDGKTLRRSHETGRRARDRLGFRHHEPARARPGGFRGAAASRRAITSPPAAHSQTSGRKTGCIGRWTWTFAKANPVTEKATARRTWPSSHISPSTSSDPQGTNEASSCAKKSPDGTQITSPTCSTRQAVNLDSLPCARRPAGRAYGASSEGGASTRPSRRRSERISRRKSQ
jgi:hypothetical protein